MLECFLSSDFKILKASNGIDGLSLVQTTLPDIVICDVMMPKMNGTDFLQLMKGDKYSCHYVDCQNLGGGPNGGF